MGYRRMPFRGGVVEYVVDGPEDARDLLIFHVGTPMAAVPYEALTRASAAHDLRVAMYSRGGYGGSTRRPGRSIVDEAAITAALADHLGHDRFLVAGWSGGGPVALACAARYPERVRACLTLAGLAPRAEAGAAFDAWVADPEDWRKLAVGDETQLAPDFEPAAARFARLTARMAIERYGTVPADRQALAGPDGLATALARSMRRANQRGFWGWLDDNVAEARDWGFRVGEVRVPVLIHQGELDRLVDVRQARWLAAAIRGASLVVDPEAGHCAIVHPPDRWLSALLTAATG